MIKQWIRLIYQQVKYAQSAKKIISDKIISDNNMSDICLPWHDVLWRYHMIEIGHVITINIL